MICVLGANGKIGRILQRAWADQPVFWQGRQGQVTKGLRWSLLEDAAPPAPAPDLVLINLAGVVRGSDEDLNKNRDLAAAACDLADRWQARHVFHCSSAAVYGAAGLDGLLLAEDGPARPISGYGAAKLAMERSVAARLRDGGPGQTCLRIGNIVGADALIGNGRAGEDVRLDPVLGQPQGPLRSYIGPAALARVLAGLADLAQRGADLPAVLNIAAPGLVGMADLLRAASIRWHWGAENPQVLGRVGLDTARLEALLPGIAGRADAAAMVAEWRDMGLGGPQ
ncbi:NAD-dependent epimerase/dehydratase family protein [Gemmobacter serpentinus]|uniref:NAD-dependent epimerase/dehydratase family protein n=1 Tax=Gemmobacter serpentinus TaxID=2652247 RepID=UPI001CF662D3|nr:NAD-dependent epimerase/dehydratase family protein [Gemmobacter serpentinus]